MRLFSLTIPNSEGRGAAAEVDAWLMGGSTRLPAAGGIKKRVFIPPASNLTKSNAVEVAA